MYQLLDFNVDYLALQKAPVYLVGTGKEAVKAYKRPGYPAGTDVSYGRRIYSGSGVAWEKLLFRLCPGSKGEKKSRGDLFGC